MKPDKVAQFRHKLNTCPENMRSYWRALLERETRRKESRIKKETSTIKQLSLDDFRTTDHSAE